MAERDSQQVSEPRPSSSSLLHTPQNNEPGWVMACKSLFWLILLPTIVLLVIRWVMQG